VRGNITRLDDARLWWDICTGEITPVIAAKAVTNAAADLLPDGALDASIWKDWTAAISAQTGAKGKALFMPLRLALTGREAGPEIASLIGIMGRDRVLERLRGKPA